MHRHLHIGLGLALLVSSISTHPVVAQTVDAYLRAGLALAPLGRGAGGGLTAGPVLGAGASVRMGSRWELGGAIHAVFYPLWVGETTCPDTGFVDIDGCKLPVTSPGTLIGGRGTVLFRLDEAAALVVGVGRTRWLSRWEQPGNDHRSAWDFTGGGQFRLPWAGGDRARLELSLTRHRRGLGYVDYSFGPVLLLAF